MAQKLTATLTARMPEDTAGRLPCDGKIERMLRAVQDGDYQTRIVQTYLNTTHFTRTAVEMPTILANLHVSALEEFFASQGYVIEGSLFPPSNIFHDSLGPSKTRLLEIALDRHQVVLDEALLLLRGSDGHSAVLIIEPQARRTGVDFTLLANTQRPTDFFTRWREFTQCHAYLRGQRFYADGELVRFECPTLLSDVRLADRIRRQIERNILDFFDQSERYRQRGLPAKRGVLLEGPPGTGKTMLCRALCYELDATFIWVTARHASANAETFAVVWQLARWLQPTVVLLEDVDLYSRSREDTYDSQVLGELMNQMDGVESNDGILTLATTNRLEVIENALCHRPGRFDRIIHVGELEEAARRALIIHHLAVEEFEEDALDRLIDHTDGYAGAHLIDLVKTLLDLAITDGAGEIDVPSGANDRNGSWITRRVVDQALEEVGAWRQKQRIGFTSG